jgi:hypothetical protein
MEADHQPPPLRAASFAVNPAPLRETIMLWSYKAINLFISKPGGLTYPLSAVREVDNRKLGELE